MAHSLLFANSLKTVVTRRRALVLVTLALVASLGAISGFGIDRSYAFNANPPYAQVGAYALYSGDGGFVAFLSGVSANISYYVSDVYPNDTMHVLVNASITLGTEVTNGSTIVTKNVTDSVYSPDLLPAIPPENLIPGKITFENVTCDFVKNAVLTVPAGEFNATEYQGKDANGTTVYFWFDRPTGLSLEMVQASSYFQLIQSNIAEPVGTQTPLQSELPFILIFVTGWAGAGLLFYFTIRHYTRKSKQSTLDDKKQELARRKNRYSEEIRR